MRIFNNRFAAQILEENGGERKQLYDTASTDWHPSIIVQPEYIHVADPRISDWKACEGKAMRRKKGKYYYSQINLNMRPYSYHYLEIWISVSAIFFVVLFFVSQVVGFMLEQSLV